MDLPRHLVVGPGGDSRILPVGVVDLQLDKFRVGVRREELVQNLRRGVEREAPMLDEAFLFLLLYEVPEVVFIVLPVVPRLEGVEQVVVKVPGSGALQAGIELLFGALLVVGAHPGTQLGGQGVALPGIAVHQGRLGRPLRVTAIVDVGGVKVGQSGSHKQVHHLLDLLHVDLSILPLGQAHQAKAQLGGICSKILSHDVLLISVLPSFYRK